MQRRYRLKDIEHGYGLSDRLPAIGGYIWPKEHLFLRGQRHCRSGTFRGLEHLHVGLNDTEHWRLDTYEDGGAHTKEPLSLQLLNSMPKIMKLMQNLIEAQARAHLMKALRIGSIMILASVVRCPSTCEV